MIQQERIPHILKYMGGKREMLDMIDKAVQKLSGIEATDFCDLFSGTAIVSYAFSDHFNVISNDIQLYSSVFANTYFSDYSAFGDPNRVVINIFNECQSVYEENKRLYPKLNFHYNEDLSFQEMEKMENEQADLINRDFISGFSLFQNCYSGTYWSYEQCLWIDSIRAVAEKYSGKPLYYAIVSALCFAMSYSAQSTGHFAQFRTLTQNNYKSVLFYRMKEVPDLFQKKLLELLSSLNHPTQHTFRVSSLDYIDCLTTLNRNTIVYADPPYSAVHYSRFYHVLETLVRYDHPKLEYKGRYREDRYQSPFDQKRNVENAFVRLFEAIKRQGCHLILSYSNNAMLKESEIDAIASRCLGDGYDKDCMRYNYHHMKMGRRDIASMDVEELLLIYTSH